jgi:hypothetical protein
LISTFKAQIERMSSPEQRNHIDHELCVRRVHDDRAVDVSGAVAGRKKVAAVGATSFHRSLTVSPVSRQLLWALASSGKLTRTRLRMDRRDQIEHAYQGARDLDGDARARFLDTQCGSDAAMRAQVEALLAQDADPRSLLQRPAVQLAAAWSAVEASHVTLTGRSVGPYQMREAIGAGGMGEVRRSTS